MKRTLLILVAAALLLAACGSADESSDPGSSGNSSDPEAPVTSAPQTPGDGEIPSPQPSIAVPQPGQEDVRPIMWQELEKGMDDQTVTLYYYSGVEPCYVLDHVDVEYGKQEVTITLFEGHTPGEGDTPCIEIAIYTATVVELDEPLDGRKVVDGAK